MTILLLLKYALLSFLGLLFVPLTIALIVTVISIAIMLLVLLAAIPFVIGFVMLLGFIHLVTGVK